MHRIRGIEGGHEDAQFTAPNTGWQVYKLPTGAETHLVKGRGRLEVAREGVPATQQCHAVLPALYDGDSGAARIGPRVDRGVLATQAANGLVDVRISVFHVPVKAWAAWLV